MQFVFQLLEQEPADDPSEKLHLIFEKMRNEVSARFC